jgi:hypothetical protein
MNRVSRLHAALLAATVLALNFACTQVANAQTVGGPLKPDDPTWEVMKAVLAVEGERLEKIGPTISGEVSGGEVRVQTLNSLPQGRYRIIGVCDPFCRSMELMQIGPNNSRLKRSAPSQDPMASPVLTFELVAAADFQVAVALGRCDYRPKCGYVLGVFREP